MTLEPFAGANIRAVQPTILLVEDDQFVRAVTCTILQRAGFFTMPAANADDAMAIHAASRRFVDLLISDMVLPGKTGLQLGQELRQLSPGMLFLLTSGYGNLEYTIETPESGRYFIAKPYSARTLVEKIETILSSAPAARSARAG